MSSSPFRSVVLPNGSTEVWTLRSGLVRPFCRCQQVFFKSNSDSRRRTSNGRCGTTPPVSSLSSDDRPLKRKYWSHPLHWDFCCNISVVRPIGGSTILPSRGYLAKGSRYHRTKPVYSEFFRTSPKDLSVWPNGNRLSALFFLVRPRRVCHIFWQEWVTKLTISIGHSFVGSWGDYQKLLRRRRRRCSRHFKMISHEWFVCGVLNPFSKLHEISRTHRRSEIASEKNAMLLWQW